jgi:hypothetical protein
MTLVGFHIRNCRLDGDEQCEFNNFDAHFKQSFAIRDVTVQNVLSLLAWLLE